MSYLNEFIQRIQKIDYPGYLTLWEEYCNSDELDADELIAILEATRKSDMASHLGRNMEKIFPLLDTLKDEEKHFEILKLIVDLQHTPSDLVHEYAIKAIEKHFSHAQKFQEKLKMVGLKSKDKIQGALRNFELLNHLEKGNFVFHPSGWGVGEILDVSFLREEFSVEFEMIAGTKTLSFQTAYKSLEPISKDHILALRFAKPDELEAFAKKDPVTVIKKLLIELGPKTAAEIKDELCDLVIPQGDWTKWWQQTRTKLKKDSHIDCPEDLKSPFRIRREEFTHEDRLKKQLQSSHNTKEVLTTLYSFFRDFPDSSKNQTCLNLAASQLIAITKSQESTTADVMSACMILEDLGNHDKKHDLENLITKEQDILPVFEDVKIIALKKRLLQLIKAHRADWKMIFELLLLHIDYNPLRDFVYLELKQIGATKELNLFVQKVVTHPFDAPDAFIWLFQKADEDEKFAHEHALKPSTLFESLLILLARLDSDSNNKSIVKKIFAMVTDDRFALVRKIMKLSSPQDVKEFILLSTKCQSFTDHEIKIFQSLAEVAHPSLAKNAKKESDLDNPNVILCTPEGYQKIQKRIHHIATVETVENAKEIEVARAHGDLRENAEFKAALERRDRLQSEMKLLSDQINIAKIISKDDVGTDCVGIGNVVICQDSKGHKHTYTILGPWEADSDKNILSYQSKLAQGMVDKKRGETFKCQDEILTILEIKSFLG